MTGSPSLAIHVPTGSVSSQRVLDQMRSILRGSLLLTGSLIAIDKTGWTWVIKGVH